MQNTYTLHGKWQDEQIAKVGEDVDTAVNNVARPNVAADDEDSAGGIAQRA